MGQVPSILTIRILYSNVRRLAPIGPTKRGGIRIPRSVCVRRCCIDPYSTRVPNTLLVPDSLPTLMPNGVYVRPRYL